MKAEYDLSKMKSRRNPYASKLKKPVRLALIMNALELKVPPLALTLIFAGAMWVVSSLFPTFTLVLPWRQALGMVIAGCGAAFAVAGVAEFRKVRTTVNPMQPNAAAVLVTSGVYRVSRNPMYVGVLFVLAGWAIYLADALAFLFLPAFVAYMNRFQIAPEERALSAKFGDELIAYRRSVRRWL